MQLAVLMAILVCYGPLVLHAKVPSVIGWPKVTLPGPDGGELTGVTILYNEPDFLRVNKSIDCYLGIPFALPPVGELRFADPVPYQIQGTYNATKDKSECTQINPLGKNPNPVFPELPREVGEDCLYLSVHTPSPKPVSPVPVLMWIHGGGFSIGGGSELLYEPTPLVALSDIIVVNVNYRLGVFGFFTTGDDVATGNFGMMDQIAALQWVQENIEVFGGDPERVTIAGESAGGVSVGLHMVSPLSDGLFHQTIMQSGNPMCPWAKTTMEKAAKSHRGFAAFVGCDMVDSQEMLDCMRAQDVNEIMKKQSLYIGGSLNTPVIDGHFIPEDPMEMIKRGQFKAFPSLIGSNEDETAMGMAFVDPPDSFYEPPVMNISTLRTMISFYASTEVEYNAIEQQYVDWSLADNASATQLDAYVRLSTDETFSCPTVYYARALEAAGADVYLYEMTHDPAWSVYAGVPKWTGAAHAEDLQYVFAWDLNPVLSPIVGQTNAEKAMSVEFMRYWTNFVKSGNPNEPSRNTYPDWPRFTLREQEYKQLSLNMSNSRGMRAADCHLWMSFLPDLHIQSAPIEEVYEDWEKQYELWRDVDVPNWSNQFEKYKEENSCPATVSH